jgi:uncharacterized RDD family membrane protein YckC
VEEEAGKPPVARLLTAGARSAGRVAHATGMDRAVDEAVEEAILRALRSPAIGRAIERAMAGHTAAAGLSSDEFAEVVRQALESEAAEQAWAEVLDSQEVQMLIERIAGAPELRAAIRAQSAGMLTDIGIRLTKVTERVDDAMERVTRPRSADSETNQAGLATRLTSFAVDVGILFLVYSVASGVIASVVSFVFGSHLTLTGGLVVGVVGYLLAGSILALFWALAGQTPGMRLLAIRLIQNGSNDVTLGCAIRRVFALILAVIPLGLGELWILRNPSRHAWQDTMTGTEIIYDPVARSSRARTRAAQTPPPGEAPAPSA